MNLGVWQNRQMAGIHHIEVWVTDIDEAARDWGWLLDRLGFTLESTWTQGQSWAAGGAHLTLTTSPNMSAQAHDRRRPGMNHLAFEAGSPSNVDSIMTDATNHGWLPLYHDRYPHAGGGEHYAGWLENAAGFKAEVVAERFSAEEGSGF